jgi:hypothetical protein
MFEKVFGVKKWIRKIDSWQALQIQLQWTVSGASKTGSRNPDPDRHFRQRTALQNVPRSVGSTHLPSGGTDVMILKIFSPKKRKKSFICP